MRVMPQAKCGLCRKQNATQHLLREKTLSGDAAWAWATFKFMTERRRGNAGYAARECGSCRKAWASAGYAARKMRVICRKDCGSCAATQQLDRTEEGKETVGASFVFILFRKNGQKFWYTPNTLNHLLTAEIQQKSTKKTQKQVTEVTEVSYLKFWEMKLSYFGYNLSWYNFGIT